MYSGKGEQTGRRNSFMDEVIRGLMYDPNDQGSFTAGWSS
jgi:hypothetical protein